LFGVLHNIHRELFRTDVQELTIHKKSESYIWPSERPVNPVTTLRQECRKRFQKMIRLPRWTIAHWCHELFSMGTGV